MVAKAVPSERLVTILDAPEEVAKEAFTFCFFPEGPLSLPIKGRFGERKKLKRFDGWEDIALEVPNFDGFFENRLKHPKFGKKTVAGNVCASL